MDGILERVFTFDACQQINKHIVKNSPQDSEVTPKDSKMPPMDDSWRVTSRAILSKAIMQYVTEWMQNIREYDHDLPFLKNFVLLGIREDTPEGKSLYEYAAAVDYLGVGNSISAVIWKAVCIPLIL